MGFLALEVVDDGFPGRWVDEFPGLEVFFFPGEAGEVSVQRGGGFIHDRSDFK